MIRAPLARLAPGPRTLDEHASGHLCRVLRMREGDRFVAFDPEARTEADATLVAASPTSARIEVGALRAAAVVAKMPVVLVYGLAKGDKVDAVVRDATELGATHVVVAQTARSVVRIDDAKRAAKAERWRRIAEQAARQSGRADPPQIDVASTWLGALGLAATIGEAKFVLDPRAAARLGDHLTGALARGVSLAFAVGPEGGLTDDEIACARDAGYAPVSLGPFVLRTETVAAAVLGAVRILERP